MGWWSLLSKGQSAKGTSRSRSQARVARPEQLELRRNLAADPIHIGGIYIEEDGGSDLHGDTFQIMFEGGAAGTQLQKLVIDTDHNTIGPSVGDLIFDTLKGGWGADEAFPLQIVSQTGIDSVTWKVADGGTKLEFEFVGFEAGDKLVFSIDVDEIQDFNPNETDLKRINESIDPITSGVEFQGSQLQGTFVAPGYFDASKNGEFRNVYDPLFVGTSLLRSNSNPNGLPEDDFNGRRDRTTGAMLPLQQEPKPVAIRGHVRLTDRNGNCDTAATESAPLSNVLVTLLDNTGKVVQTTRTNATGEYGFEGLKPGKYTVVETTPTDLIDGDEHVGNVGGKSRGNVGGNDTIRDIELGPGEEGRDYDFCEHLPGEIAGYVYYDQNNDGNFDEAEFAIAKVTMELQDASGKVLATTTTDANGYYRFGGLAAGEYRVIEYQPNGWTDGLDTAGKIRSITVGHVFNPGDVIDEITLLWGDQGSEYNFGELKSGSLSGFVFSETDNDCIFDSNELPIAGVLVELLNADGKVVESTITNAAGFYEFKDIPVGTYAVREIQPAGYFQGGQVAGSGGGDATTTDKISKIKIDSGARLTQYNFCENPGGAISGYVFRDGPEILTVDGKVPPNLAAIRDGKLTADDLRLGGVVLELRYTFDGRPVLGEETIAGTNPAGPLRAVTDANGYYQFTGLRSQDYTIIEVQPASFIDSIDTPGTAKGFAINEGETPTPEQQSVLDQLDANGLDVKNDAIVRISLNVGQVSQFNNFSEVAVVPTVVPPPPPPEEVLTPPTKAVLQPFNQPSPNNLVPTPQTDELISGRASRAFTWHLSLMDGGNPRSTKSTTKLNGSVWRSARALDRSAWRAEYANGGEWLIPVGPTAKKFRFGMPGATPLAGDFNGDGHSELAFYLDGEWFIDVNGNGRWDDADLWAQLGSKKDRPVVGDWDGDGKDDIGIYGPEWVGDLRHIEAEPGVPDVANRREGRPKNVPPDLVDATSGERVLRATADGDARSDLIDHVFRFGQPNDIPIAGDWNGDGVASIGIFRDGKWHFDNDGDGRWSEGDHSAFFGQVGDRPVVGDWDGDGKDQMGVFRNGEWILDTNGNQVIDSEDQHLQLGQAGDKPVVGDWNGDGIDEPGLYHDKDVSAADDATESTEPRP